MCLSLIDRQNKLLYRNMVLLNKLPDKIFTLDHAGTKNKKRLGTIDNDGTDLDNWKSRHGK